MKKIIILLFLAVVIVGCQQSNLNIDKDVTSIEIYAWENDKKIITLNNTDFINGLVTELNEADAESTANMDYPLPDYKLLFKNDGETVFEIGYYIDIMNLGVKGRYLDVNNDIMYEVSTELPVDLSSKKELTIRNEAGEILATTSDLTDASIEVSEYTGYPLIQFSFIEKGKLESITEEHVGETLPIYYGDELISSPRVGAPIPGDIVQIEGNFDQEVAEKIVITINSQ